jgi:putative dimethyl sulfoxide reductase chaperone
MTQDEWERGIARADLCRFLAACYYQPGPEFAEEKMFDSMLAAAVRVSPDFGARARRMRDAFTAEDPQTLLVDYTRLFLGPVDALAKPYGSAWLGGQQALMQDSTMAVQQLYAEGGFEISEDFRELPDHVAAELEFLYLLIFRETAARRDGDLESLEAMAAVRRRFLAQHLGAWIGSFARAIESGAQTKFYRELAELTKRFVGAESGAVGA